MIALNRSPYVCCCMLCVSGFGLCACGSLWLFATAVCVCRSETVLCCLGAARVIGSPVWDSLMSLVVMRLYVSFLWDWLISKLQHGFVTISLRFVCMRKLVLRIGFQLDLVVSGFY